MSILQDARSSLTGLATRAGEKAKLIKAKRDYHSRLAELGAAYFRGRENEEDTDAELDRLMDEVRVLADQLDLEEEPTVDLTDRPANIAVDGESSYIPQ